MLVLVGHANSTLVTLSLKSLPQIHVVGLWLAWILEFQDSGTLFGILVQMMSILGILVDHYI